MLVIIGILTVAAWHRGWKAYALMPLMFDFLLALSIYSREELIDHGNWINYLMIIALIVMIVKKRPNDISGMVHKFIDQFKIT